MTWLDSGRGVAIEGFCSKTSAEAGEDLSIYVSVPSECDVSIDIYRMGFYAGTGARLMLETGPIRVRPQRGPKFGDNRLVECDWHETARVPISKEWLSGVYLGKLTRLDDGTESYVTFVVRDRREAELLAQTSNFTWQAYNRWPDAYSLYSNGTDDLTAYYGTDVLASFDRPYLSTTYFNTPIPGTGEYFVFEYPFTYWLEKEGYDVTYCTNHDTHTGRAEFTRAKAFLSIGHDEYVTRAMYDNLIRARDSGVSLGFFTGNSYCFEISVGPSSDGNEDRVIARVDAFGPDRSPESGYVPQVDEEAYADQYPFPMEAPDEGLLMGARNAWPIEGVGDWACSLPDHWLFDGTDMAEGDVIPNLVGHEWHGSPADIPGLEVVSTGGTWEPGLGDGQYAATVYSAPSGSVVFNAATCWWSTGLAHPPGFQRPTWHDMPSGLPDGRVQQITRNVLDRMVSRG
ncbi:N,N-dimethylformamidase beta subunit family domain-containing protein [Rhodococcoides kroppenstedtii]|uniref:N,N-dimethylformamidase beta subunit family domain-containing protein n=1 Tax=Rhodococcoides kroppenstedtii TaxID=293050 RepID=UPI0028E51DD6|nr:N,N-dimethylformamidase beta subunit family domain-containing protein [Rhodococcus kroppenstedtii]